MVLFKEYNNEEMKYKKEKEENITKKWEWKKLYNLLNEKIKLINEKKCYRKQK